MSEEEFEAVVDDPTELDKLRAELVLATTELASAKKGREDAEKKVEILDKQTQLLREQLGVTRTAFAKAITELLMGPAKTEAHRQDEALTKELVGVTGSHWSQMVSAYEYRLAR